MRKSRTSFKRLYLIYLGILGIFAAAALIYVLVLLRQYEKSQPEQQVWKAIDELSAQAADGSFSSLYELPEAEPGAFEKGRDLRKEYLALYGKRDDMTLTKSSSSIKGDTLEYQVECGGAVIAKVGLKAEGSPVTKLAVFNPFLISLLICIAFLKFFDIPLEWYNKGGDIIAFFLAPATVALALPLYRQLPLLRQYAVPVAVGGLVGAVTAIVLSIRRRGLKKPHSVATTHLKYFVPFANDLTD